MSSELGRTGRTGRTDARTGRTVLGGRTVGRDAPKGSVRPSQPSHLVRRPTPSTEIVLRLRLIGPPPEDSAKLRRLLKQLLRGYRLQCVSIEDVPPSADDRGVGSDVGTV